MFGIAANSSHSRPPVVRDDVEPIAHEARDRTVTGAATVVPFLLLAVAGWQAWGGALRARHARGVPRPYAVSVLRRNPP